MLISTPPYIQVINFVQFRNNIEEALDLNSMYSPKMIKQEDYPFLVLLLENYLIKNCGFFDLRGKLDQLGDIHVWFDRETLIEEFDDLYLKFREYLITIHGLNAEKKYTLIRHFDSDSFILYEGEIDVPSIQHSDLPSFEDSETLQFECDPFLPVVPRLY